MAPVIQKLKFEPLNIKTPKSHRKKYEVSIHDYRHHNRQPGFEVKSCSLTSHIFAGPVFSPDDHRGALSGKHPVDELLRLGGDFLLAKRAHGNSFFDRVELEEFFHYRFA